jgi:hypothetical protein
VIAREPIGADGRRTTLGLGQPEYDPLPARVTEGGIVTTEWALSDEERRAITAGGHVRLEMLTFNRGFPPVRLTVVRED